MTKAEITGKRDLKFSQWIRENLPDSYEGFRVTDLDFILADVNKKRIMLIEVKTRNSHVRPWQRQLFKLINNAFINGLDKRWKYLGFHLVGFENTDFEDGCVYLDDEPVTEAGLIEFLSLRKD